MFVQHVIGTSPPVETRDSGGSLTIYGEVPPKLMYGPDGTLYAAYLTTRALPGHEWPTNTLRFTSSSDGGAHWRAPVTVRGETDDGGSTDDHALAVMPDGTLLLSWLAHHHPVSHTFIARSTDHGMHWSAPVMIDSGPSCPCCRTALSVAPNGTVYAAWRKVFSGTTAGAEIRDIVVAASHDGGTHWDAPVRVHADNWQVNYCPDAGPAIIGDSNDVVHVAWWTGKPGSAGVRYVQSSNGGRSFGAPVELGVAPMSRPSHVQLSLGHGAQRGTVIAAWEDGTRNVPIMTVAVSRDNGAHFRPSTFGDPMSQAGYPVVALHGDTVHVVWQSQSHEMPSHDSMVHPETASQMHMHHEAPSRAGQAMAAEKINAVATRQIFHVSKTLDAFP